MTLFNGLAGERSQLVSQLQQHVSSLGGEPEDDGTILAGAHRVFLNLKSVVTGHDDKAIINEIEAGEDHIKAKYEDALEDRELSSAVQSSSLQPIRRSRRAMTKFVILSIRWNVECVAAGQPAALDA